jgi:pyrroline-5-carboxylate reductase
MTKTDRAIGIVGGTGMLGMSIAVALLDGHVVSPERLWISNRSGTADAFADHPGVNVTSSNQELADRCDVILLAVPPASASGIGVDASGKLVLSVMAGIALAELVRITGANRAIRAMSSPAARASLAYSPWFASADVTDDDRALVSTIFAACGLTDEVDSEAQIECFTAITGPVPGFVAFYAAAMVDYAVHRDIPPKIADRAIRQLFLGAGTMMSDGEMTPADHVKWMIDYAGTTAAGLEAMNHSSITAEIAEALDAAVSKTRVIG